MKLTLFVSTALVATLVSAAVIQPQLKARQTSIQSVDCLENLKYLGGFGPDCPALAHDCIYNQLKGTANLWSYTSCVAAATCVGTQNIYIAANCTDPAIPDDPSQLASLDYNLYANIVGSCAWDEGGCPITFQNYVDFYYGALSAIGSTNWPSSVDVVRSDYWDPLVNWTATGDTIPYTNFNDWLHYSEYIPEYFNP